MESNKIKKNIINLSFIPHLSNVGYIYLDEFIVILVIFIYLSILKKLKLNIYKIFIIIKLIQRKSTIID